MSVPTEAEEKPEDEAAADDAAADEDAGTKTEEEEAADAAPAEPEYADEGRILGITVHKTDKLKSDLSISHPIVKVSVVNAENGSYLKKQHV